MFAVSIQEALFISESAKIPYLDLCALLVEASMPSYQSIPILTYIAVRSKVSPYLELYSRLKGSLSDIPFPQC